MKLPRLNKKSWLRIILFFGIIAILATGYYILRALDFFSPAPVDCGTNPADVIIVMDNSDKGWSENQRTVATSIVNKMESSGGIGAGKRYRVAIIKNTTLGNEPAGIYVSLTDNMNAAGLLNKISTLSKMSRTADNEKLTGVLNIAANHQWTNLRTDDDVYLHYIQHKMIVLSAVGDANDLTGYDESTRMPLYIDPLYTIAVKNNNTKTTVLPAFKALARPTNSNYIELDKTIPPSVADSAKIETMMTDFVANKVCAANITLTGNVDRNNTSYKTIDLTTTNTWTKDSVLPIILFRTPKEVGYNYPLQNQGKGSTPSLLTIDQVKAVCTLMTGNNLRICSELTSNEAAATANFKYYSYDLGGLAASKQDIMRSIAYVTLPTDLSCDFSAFVYLSGGSVVDQDYSDNQFNTYCITTPPGETPTPPAITTGNAAANGNILGINIAPNAIAVGGSVANTIEDTQSLDGYINNTILNKTTVFNQINTIINSQMKNAVETGSVSDGNLNLYGQDSITDLKTSSSSTAPEGKLWKRTGDMNLSYDTIFSGRGTIVVSGDLRIQKGFSCSANSQVGIIAHAITVDEGAKISCGAFVARWSYIDMSALKGGNIHAIMVALGNIVLPTTDLNKKNHLTSSLNITRDDVFAINPTVLFKDALNIIFTTSP